MHNILKFTKGVRKQAELTSKKPITYTVVLVASITLLLLTTVYAAVNTSSYFSTNSDAIIATQQFSKGVPGNTIALPGSHSNILMMPLLYVQGHLPYHYKSFVALNALLVLTTISAWALLLIKLFGRKYEVPVLVLLSSLLFASVTFNIGIGNTTFRNLGIPIALGFVFIVNALLQKSKFSRNEKLAMGVGSLLFCVLLAGDSFFIFSIVGPLVFVIFWYWFQSKKFTVNMGRVLGLVAGIVVGSVIIKWVFAALKLVYFDYVFLGKPTVVSYENLGPSLQVTLRQLVELQGGTIFGEVVSIKQLLAFINLGILIIGFVGLTLILVQAGKAYRASKQLAKNNEFVIVVLAASYFAVLLDYVLSGYAVIKMPDGHIIDFMNTRYLTLLPLITIASFIWVLQRYYSELRYGVMLCMILVVGIIAYHPTVKTAYALQNQNKPVPSKASVDELIGYLTANHIDEIVTDFWYGPPIRFWSSDKIQYAPVITCKYPIPFDSRADWYQPVKGKKTALIIDRGGLNFGYWSCTDDELKQIYGEPAAQTEAAGIHPGEIVKVWVYDYDVRERLAPFPSK